MVVVDVFCWCSYRVLDLEECFVTSSFGHLRVNKLGRLVPCVGLLEVQRRNDLVENLT